ncbi:carotenoid oxygenase family protein [Thalassorhabdomicrobium marinisediminis]|uniref:carotenoid oxygenase family protein n=1 Tax=Thalassorhabdomicrobium marinisediminis TaxID=2170577 RepID=UPI00248F4ECD|nr:carotenoid oxygenase family protein [Thalassorhabdomicrobium marinisediminis]
MPEIFAHGHSTVKFPNDNPYLNGPHKPIDLEYTAKGPDLEVIGEIPKDLQGMYVRNGHNQVHEPIGRYHPFDGDGMLHAVWFNEGKVEYRNRYTMTTGLMAERAAGRSLWPGMIEPRKATRRGWGSIGHMKDNTGTDVLVHSGKIIVAMSQCSEPYRLDTQTLETLGPDENWARVLGDRGICSHFKVDEHTGHMMFFNFAEKPPYMNYGVVDPENNLVHYVPIELEGPRFPHDMGMSENYCVLHDLPLFFDPEMLKQGKHRLGFHRDVPSRFGVIPRFGTNEDVKWFDAEPCYLLHLSNTYEEGDEIIMDGCIIADPIPDMSDLPKDGYERLNRMLDMHTTKVTMHRWRFNMRTGETKEERLDDEITEFPMVNGMHNGRDYRYSYNALPQPGSWLLDGLKKFDLKTGATQKFMMPKGEFVSEAPFAPRINSKGEDDGYVVTFVTNVNSGKGECVLFDAANIDKGPICRIIMPYHIPTGAHAFWAGSHMLYENGVSLAD